jgi:hypothetical protein
MNSESWESSARQTSAEKGEPNNTDPNAGAASGRGVIIIPLVAGSLGPQPTPIRKSRFCEQCIKDWFKHSEGNEWLRPLEP